MFLPHRLLESISGTLREIHFVLKCQFAPEYEKCTIKDKTWKLNFILVYNMWVFKKKSYVLVLSLFSGVLFFQHHERASPQGSSIYGILQARILEWAAMPSSRGHLPDLGIEPTSPAYPTLKVSCVPLSHWESHPPSTKIRMKCVKILTNSINLHGTISWFTV